MREAVKEKVTVSLDPHLLESVDREVGAHHAGSRSEVVEEALGLWQLEKQRQSIERGVAAYYQSRSRKEAQEDRAWARLASRQAKRFWND